MSATHRALSKAALVGLLAKHTEQNDARFRGHMSDARYYWRTFYGPSTSTIELAVIARNKNLIDDAQLAQVKGRHRPRRVLAH